MLEHLKVALPVNAMFTHWFGAAAVAVTPSLPTLSLDKKTMQYTAVGHLTVPVVPDWSTAKSRNTAEREQLEKSVDEAGASGSDSTAAGGRSRSGSVEGRGLFRAGGALGVK